MSHDWARMADRVLADEPLSTEQGLEILRADDAQLLEILAAAYRVRHRHRGNRVHLNFLINAKSGHCGEDCGYCSQSSFSKAEIPTYKLLDAEQILDGARVAAERRAKTYCTVISGRGPSQRDFDTITRVVPRIKAQFGLSVCVSPGLLTAEQAMRLKDCGVDRVIVSKSRWLGPRPEITVQ